MEVIDLVLFTYVVFTTKEHHVRKILAGGNVDCAALLEDDDIALRRGRALKVALVADVPVSRVPRLPMGRRVAPVRGMAAGLRSRRARRSTKERWLRAMRPDDKDLEGVPSRRPGLHRQ
jgi:hypothetical protein